MKQVIIASDGTWRHPGSRRTAVRTSRFAGLVEQEFVTSRVQQEVKHGLYRHVWGLDERDFCGLRSTNCD